MEFHGTLTLHGSVQGITCLRVAGALVVSGNLSVMNCRFRHGADELNKILDDVMARMKHFLPDDTDDDVNNEVDDDEWEESLMERVSKAPRLDNYGGGIHAAEVLHLNGTINITNCSAEKGGAIRTLNFSQLGGHVHIHNCNASAGGGIWSRHFTHESGKCQILQCNADAKKSRSFGDNRGQGGGIFVEELFRQSGGQVIIQRSAAHGWDLEGPFKIVNDHSFGGAVRASEFELSGGSLTIQLCASERGGGLATSKNQGKGTFTQSGGYLMIENCSGKHGGGIDTDIFHHSQGQLVAKDCHAENGAAIHTDTFMQTGGNLKFQNCSAKEKGGAVRSSHSFTQSWGHLSMDASERGGGLTTSKNQGKGTFTQSGGYLMIENCSGKRGGGIDTDIFHHSQGQLVAKDCHAENGAAIHTDTFMQTGGNLKFQNCSAKEKGGAVRSSHSFTQSWGHLSMDASERGGGLATSKNQGKGTFTQSGGYLMIENCSGKHGGGIDTDIFHHSQGQLVAKDCHAENGAAIHTDTFMQTGGNLKFQNCSAKEKGGAVRSSHSFTQSWGHLSMDECVAASGGAIAAEDEFWLEGGDVTIQGCKAQRTGGAIATAHFHQMSGSLAVQGCVAHVGGGGIDAASFELAGEGL